MVDVTVFISSWLTLFSIYGILALCLNMEVGYAGMVNTGLVSFYGIGSFVASYLSLTAFLSFFGYNYPIYSLDAIIAMGRVSGANPALSISVFLLSLVASFLISGTVGYLISYPTLRVGPAFLGITILSFGEMLRIFMKHFAPTGGSYGLLGVPNPFGWLGEPTLKSILFAVLAMSILAITYVYFETLANSPYGRLLRSIREDEVASLCMGKSVPRVKAQLLFIASGLSGVAGALLAFYQGSVSPDMFTTAVTFEVWSMVILGGRGNNLGVLAGAAVISLLGWFSSALNFYLPDLAIDPNYIRWMMTGLVIVTILLYKPKGMLPEKPVYTKVWSLFDSDENGKALSRGITKVKRAFNWLARG
ncbi:MAG: branched-chain amino acid ABC transporter permease [Candidatus Bathyarchaeia archaeon]